jgi:amino acid adenylation domain-containing protein
MTMPAQPDMQSIGARLAEVAARVPDHPAIVERDVSVTYAALDALATAIAWRIVACRESRPGAVCLLFERKLATVAALFGAARSGHPYVPLDAGDPDARLRFIVGDCEPVALLTEAALEARARAIAPGGCDVVVIDDLHPGGDAVPLPAVASDASAYLHYTSGSTGQPKGIGQTHRNVLFLADRYANALRIGAADRLSLLYTMSFAAANNAVFRALLHGATLCAYDLRRDGIAALADWLDRQRITVLHLVPTAFRELAARLAADRLLPHLRAIHLGGELVFASDVELFRAHTLDHCILVNQLASTEAGPVAQAIVDHRSTVAPGSVVPVGRCIDGVRVEIRREDGALAGIGEVGELIVCSRYASPGYWRRPELNAAAFSPDPADPEGRRFRSGDLGHVDAAGNLHFLARKGSRVKIRGHSVDLTEIEAALATCPGLAAAAVTAIDDAPPRPVRLLACIVRRDDAPPDPQAVRRHLAARLPMYMLPADIVYVDALPLTASGKVDRLALAQLPVAAGRAERRIDAPEDGIERKVADVFKGLLDVAHVGRDDDFFLLGGDSLASAELQLRLTEVFGVPVRNFQRDATVAAIAAGIRATAAEQARSPQRLPVLMPLWQNGREPPLFLVHGRHGQAFVSPHFMRLLGDDQPVWVFQARGLDGVSEPHASVEDMAAEYLAELRRQRPRGPYFLGSLCAGVYIVAAMARTLREAGETVLPLLLLDPPNSVLQPGYSQLTEAQFVDKMKARRARGVTAGPTENRAYVDALLRTAMAFEHAIAKHRPLPYDGPVYVLSSYQRMRGGDAFDLRRIFTGRYKRYEVGTTHAQSLDPRNPVFASALRRCVELIREAGHERPSLAYRVQGGVSSV